VNLERLIRDDPLQPDVLNLELLQALDILGLHPAVLRPPPVIRRLRDQQLLDNLRQLDPNVKTICAATERATPLLERKNLIRPPYAARRATTINVCGSVVWTGSRPSVNRTPR
jgi:hypothetical protein